MSEQDDLQQKLLEMIKAKRTSTASYASALGSRTNRLTNISIVCAALTAVMTAGPALGRDKFTALITGIITVPDSAVWGVLCLLAMVLSVVAAIVNNMNRSQDVVTRLAKAQTATLLFDKLIVSIEMKQITGADATKLYEEYLADISFIP